jgi:Protein of unknown function (DUF1552)
VSSLRFSRRSFIKYTGASAAFVPLLHADMARGQAAGFPQRLVTVAFGHGICGPYFWPQGDQIAISATSCQTLLPLAAYSSKMLLIGGLDNKVFIDHGQHYAGHTSYPGLFTGTLNGNKSIDQAVADGLQAKGINKPALQLVLGVEPDGNSISYKAGGQMNTPETNPWTVFTRLFSSLTLPPDMLAKINAHKQSMLDYLGKDIAAFSARVGTDDRIKIQAHLQSIRDLEAQIQATTSAGGGGPTCAAPNIGASRTLDTPTHAALMFQLLGAALRCDLTRVASMTIEDCHGRFNVRFPWLNVPEDYHPLAHEGASGYTDKVKIDTWMFQQVAALANDLNSSMEGGVTALDNSVIVVSSNMAEGAAHTVGGLPFVLIGGCGGAIKADGRCLKLGKWAGKTSKWMDDGGVPLNQLLASLSNAMGLPPVAGYGDPAYPGTLDSVLR